MSKLTRIIGLLYRMTTEDTADLESQLLNQMKAAWKVGIKDEAREHGCNGVARDPSGSDLRHLRDIAQQDARSITDTYNRDVQREIERLYSVNPRGNRQFYTPNMERYIRRRNAHKSTQITLNTETVARSFAKQRFLANNGLRGGQYMLVGPPAVCPICLKAFAMGAVSQAYVDAHPTPLHIACPHEWRSITNIALNCTEVWLG